MVSGIPSRERPRGTWRPVLALLGVLVVAVSAAGCVSIPGGPVQSYTVTQGPGAQSQHYQQITVQPPGNGWSPEEIVTGFITASASFANRQQIAREYLTPGASRTWNRSWSATVYSSGPTVTQTLLNSRRNQAEVTVSGTVQAKLTGQGSYAVPLPKEQGIPPTFNLVKVNGQWRISAAPSELLLSSDSFKYDYQLRNLYFFDPTMHFLVPDPVYVPLQATPSDLMNGLVQDLIAPPPDWLSRGATNTAFPLGTRQIGDVTLDGGTAFVNLGGAITKVPTLVMQQVMQQVSAQLWWTLKGSGQGGPAVQSVEVSENGKPWIPLNSDENPVQNQPAYNPPTGASDEFYYLDNAGNLLSQSGTQVSQSGTQGKPTKVTRVGAGFSQIAVSPDGRYLAALHQGSLFIGPANGKLSKRDGSGYTTMSWDPADNLWATTGDQIVMLRGAADPARPQGQQVSVTVVNFDGSSPFGGPYTSLRVAPDGVRVAIIIGQTNLYFGAIVWPPDSRAGQAMIKIVLSPFYVTGSDGGTFSSVTWYGPDNVITLGGPGPSLTEYPVNGSSSTSIPAEPRIRSITASVGSALIAGLTKGGMTADRSLSGSWIDIGSGVSPAYPG